ncbi:2-dehydropantoate 2-reductase [Limnohabitans sp. MMS-10A-160]|uniref:2-dehydropantoate 2-reductase n=1 Tax=unclassified Limnohabitans TaxID=2626134 RepID=UPI000D3ACB3F|nr:MULTISPECIES: 2-dehydropantoate 2-reductase [unclassified Limnohabitans]PUE19238.1 2-dehydropantoate 2-reductase [Limnohabitans sp. MMS-10A-192]PUE24568.1 2-dehydropantoate 2-reductase [Limnohabitans sp. MMS-10A-160]
MSEVQFKKVAIVGAGAIGGWMGVHLAQAGAQVSVLARVDTLQALQKSGLQMHQGGTLHSVPVSASNDAATLGVQDLVVISVKAPALASVAAQVGPLIGPNTVVLTAMNGVPWWFLQGFGGPVAGRSLSSVDPEGAIAQALPAQHIIGCVVHASCSVDAPGVIRHHFGDGLIVGEPSGESSPRVQALHALLQQAGFNATLSPQIQKDIWYKLWGNMTVNPVSAITGATTDRILDDELVRGFISNVMLEAKAIGERIGIPIAQEPEDRHAMTRKLGAFKTSMLQDVQAGKPVELDALVSAVRELGQLTQVATPFTDALLGLSRLHASGLGLYPAQ